ncbi:MAG: S41 family peptidase [Candidatus Hodarchaeales archaeon]
MMKKNYTVVITALAVMAAVSISIFVANLPQPYKITVNSISPADMGNDEWLEDFECFYEFVEGNYPFLDIKNRTHSYNWLDLKDTFEERLKNAEDNADFFNIMMATVEALQNRHTYVMHPGLVRQYSSDYKDWNPLNEIFNEEIANAADYWTDIHDQYNRDKFNSRYDVLIVYEKGEYIIHNYNTTWKLLYGDESVVTHVNGASVDDAIKTLYDREYLDLDYKLYKNYIWSIFPRHFGDDALFTVKNSTGHTMDVRFGIEEKPAEIPYSYPSSLVNCTVYSDKSIAYLYAGSFSTPRIEQYADDVANFYQQINDIDNLIIDIRGNTGGFYSVWIDNIVRPLIKEDIRHEQYFAYKSGKHVNYFHQQWVTKMDRVSKNQFDYLPPELLTSEFNIYKNYYTFTPVPATKFNGNITLLIDNMVFSAAEGFANFCKEKGFAKIYGTTSGGDGIMLYPQYFVLPNSKIVIGMASVVGFDSTGYANEEVRTQPDVYYESSFGEFDELINHVMDELNQN